MKKQKINTRKAASGITLIALVITIIVLLILAGVSINLVVGDSGVLNKATSAKSETLASEEKEKITLSLSSARMNDVENLDRKITAKELEDEINNSYGEGTVTVKGTDDLVVKYSKSKNRYTVTQKGKVEEKTGIDEEEAFATVEKPSTQIKTNDIAISETGIVVNLDSWSYVKVGNGYELNSGADVYSTGYTNDDIENGKIKGEIPAYIKDENGEIAPVTSLAYAFIDCTDLKIAPEIPNTVTDMTGAFYGCVNLEEPPVIPDSVTEVGYMFYRCESLETAPKIPNSVTVIDDLFISCKSLKTVPELPDTIISMDGTFNGCSSLESISKLPSNVISLDNTFAYCQSLKISPTIPNSVKTMRHTFDSCTSLKEAPIIPNSVVDMGGTFIKCSSLEVAPEIPKNVTNMNATFCNCTSLITASKIPDSVTNVSLIYMNCNLLKTPPTIPSLVTDMNHAFSGCSSLTGTLTINATPTKYGGFLKDASINEGCSLKLEGTCSTTVFDAIIAAIKKDSYTENDTAITY